MLYFLSDYTEGAHPKILERLQETNLVSQPGYGEDCFCAAAREKIRAACGKPGVQPGNTPSQLISCCTRVTDVP